MAKLSLNQETLADHSTEPPEVTKVRLTWENVKLSIKQQVGRKKTVTTEILKGVNGSAEPGELLAVMGTSGAGKTCLINVLNGWVKPNKTRQITGEIKANGVPIDSLEFGRIAGNVLQDDSLLAYLTVRESLEFSADLRTSFSKKEKDLLIEKLLHDLRLKEVEHSLVGSADVRGISGGEKKRVCIGIELIVNPSVLFLDEPTSGLDSFTALATMKLIKHQSELGRTVICTLHQPSSEIVELIDSLVVMTDGYIVYQSSPVNIQGWFERIGFPFPQYGNPIDYILHICAKDDEHFPCKDDKIQLLLKAYQAEFVLERDEVADEGIKSYNQETGTIIKQLKYLFGRATKETFRNKEALKSKIGTALFLGGIYNMLYNGLDTSRKGVQNRHGLFLMMYFTMVLSGCLQVVMSLPLQRAVFIKEQGNKMYGTFAFLLAKCFSEAFMEAIIPSLFFVFQYWIDNLNTSSPSKPLTFWGVLLLSHFLGGSFGLLFGSIVSNVMVILELSSIIFIWDTLYSGFYANFDSLPIPFKYLTYVVPARYAFSAMAQIEFDGLDFDCEDAEVDPCDPLEDLNINVPLWLNIVVLGVMMVMYRVLAGLYLKWYVWRMHN